MYDSWYSWKIAPLPKPHSQRQVTYIILLFFKIVVIFVNFLLVIQRFYYKTHTTTLHGISGTKERKEEKEKISLWSVSTKSFDFLKMSLLSDLININLSDTTKKVIVEYIWLVSPFHFFTTHSHPLFPMHYKHALQYGMPLSVPMFFFSFYCFLFLLFYMKVKVFASLLHSIMFVFSVNVLE